MKKILCFVFSFLYFNACGQEIGFEKCYKKYRVSTEDELNGDIALVKKRMLLKDSLWRQCIVQCLVPPFSIKTIDGESINTDSLKNKILFINFWFIGCAPCLEELPALNRLVEEYKDRNVVFLSITHDSSEMVLSNFLVKHQIKLKLITDAMSICRKYAVTTYPTTFIIDTNKKVKGYFIGIAKGKSAKSYIYEEAQEIINTLLDQDAK